MNKKDIGMFFYFKESPDLQKKWPAFLTLGILLIILGIFAIGFAGFATIFTVELLGFFLIFAGIFLIVNAFQIKQWKGVTLSLLLGILYIAVGAICIFKPYVAASGITLLLAALFFVGGLFRMISTLMYRFEHWGWMFFSGLIAFILGILIVVEWPFAALWLIGLYVGIDILIIGCNLVALSLAAKRQLK